MKSTSLIDKSMVDKPSLSPRKLSKRKMQPPDISFSVETEVPHWKMPKTLFRSSRPQTAAIDDYF
jgi:hypothetical protein